MALGIERVFLGWHAGVLDRAAGWVFERHPGGAEKVLVALPGSRAVRALREKLARLAPPSWTPPRILTQGDLIDEMVRLDRPVAGRLARTLAWSRALGELPRERLERLAAQPPDPGDLRGAFALAETVRGLHADLAQEGLGFAHLASGASRPTHAGEARRFEVLAEAQQLWHKILGELGLADPHESRFAAIDDGRLDPERQVILVGVADMNRLLRQVVERLGKRAVALVVAPDEEAGAFDELGCVRTAAWRHRDLDLPERGWHVVEGPESQAEAAVSILTGFEGRFAPEEISIGLCDEEVAPHLERRFLAEDVVARHAAGTPLSGTRPVRLLADLAAWLKRRRFEPYAALVRHPDLEAALRARGTDAGEADAPTALDAYHADHLPAEIDGTILGGAREPMRAIHPCVVDLLGGLATEERRPLGEWPMIVRTFLATVYAGEIDRGREPDRVLAEALGDLAQVLAEIERLPAALAREPVAANEALDLVVTAVRGGAVPPAPSSPGTAEVELLGWLELPLDEARALVVTGFQEGFVPSVRRDDPFLPDGLRRRLGLPSADDRVARDVYAATVLLRSKQAIAFVSGRRNRDGDPRMPSRLAFHVPRERLLARVAAMAVEPAPRRSAPVRGGKSYELPRLGKTPPVTSMPVTAFRTFLASPYLFYLERVLQLETVDDRARELDPAGFGSLAHDILQAFGESDARDSTDAKEIETWLRKRLEQVGRARFGPQPLPAVDLQLAQLGRRFALFARAQAARAAEGWRIHAAEWKPKAAVHLSMGDGEPPMELKGMIDRIDVHEATGAWSILDYKTSFLAKDPAGVHRKRSGWRDLQLPLYTLLAAELGHETVPTLGYFNLGKDEAGTGVRETGWTREDLDSAFEAAREVVVRIRGEEFFELGPSFADRGEILLAIAGKGLVLSETEESDDAEGEEGDA